MLLIDLKEAISIVNGCFSDIYKKGGVIFNVFVGNLTNNLQYLPPKTRPLFSNKTSFESLVNLLNISSVMRIFPCFSEEEFLPILVLASFVLKDWYFSMISTPTSICSSVHLVHLLRASLCLSLNLRDLQYLECQFNENRIKI